MSEGDVSRRRFLGGSAAAAGLSTGSRWARAAPGPQGSGASGSDMVDVTLEVNGRKHALRLEPRVSLLDAVREELRLTGTKKGRHSL